MLGWIFGKVVTNKLYLNERRRVSGYLEFEKANVKWFLSLEKDDLPNDSLKEGKPTFRSLKIDGEDFLFSDGFTDLHTKVYKSIMNGSGFGLEDARQSIEIVHELRNKDVSSSRDFPHPLLVRENKR